jgi:predicted amidohydrolase YtcJ
MDGAASFGHLQRLHGVGELGLNVVHAVPIRNLDSAITLGLRSGLGDDRFRVGGTKIFADGALGSQTALMFADYPGRPGYNGVGVYAPEELGELAKRAVTHGWALWIHAIGDLAVDQVSKVIAKAGKLGHRDLVHRIEHVQCARPAAIRRMGKHGIVGAVQPCHVPGDIQTAERHWPKASRNAYPFRQLLDAGVVLALGSDVPVERIDPRLSLWAAVCRTDEQGEPAGGWYADQQITLREALIGFTRGSAMAAGLPEPHGQLKVGAPADLTVWGSDPLKLRRSELRDAPILGVIHAGEPFLV